MGRKAPLGNNIQNQIAHLPKYILQVSYDKVENGVTIRFSISLKNASEIQEKCTIDKNSQMVLLIGDSFNNIFIYEKYTHSYLIQNPVIGNSFDIDCPVKHEIYFHFISQIWGVFIFTRAFNY